jgi:hypothetical protein
MNTKKNIEANQPFQALGTSIAFYAPEGGELSFSVDGVNYSAYEETVEADTNVFVNGVVPGMFFRFSSDIIAKF